MKIILAGGSGFLGRALQRRLQQDGHAVAILTRRPRPTVQEDIAWTPDGTAGHWARVLNDVEAVVNLAGEGLADQRWTEARKQQLRASRVLATRSLVAAIAQVATPPRVLLSGSGINYYGPRGDELVTEADPPGNDFIAQLCVEWEREADQASATTRVVIVRTGIVLHPGGGALAQLLLPFRFGVGGPIASGRQYMPWIHISDWVDLATWLIMDPSTRGAFNGTAPNPVTNATFTRTLGRVVRRPTIVPVPAFGLRLAFGEVADLLVTGQRAIPARALESGFQFHYTELEPALRHLLE